MQCAVYRNRVDLSAFRFEPNNKCVLVIHATNAAFQKQTNGMYVLNKLEKRLEIKQTVINILY